jgi:hypothetical protein
MVRVGKLSLQDGPATIFVAGRSNTATSPGVELAALSGDGTTKWSVTLEAPNASVGAAMLAPGKPWLALGLQGGLVYVIDAEKGTVLARTDGQGFSPEVAWMKEEGKDAPILVVSTRARLNAYRINESR